MPLLYLLGSPRHAGDGGVTDLPVNQALFLGTYLACKDDWASRDELLLMFWPDENEKTARHNLSQLVYHCKQQVWFARSGSFEAERSRLRWRVDSDVGLFRDMLGQADWAESVTHYGGQLLESCPVAESAGFQDWLEQERESLHASWRDAVLNHVKLLEQQGEDGRAATLLKTVLQHDLLAEDVMQAFMHHSERAGQRQQALQIYEAFRNQLARELDIEPLETTVNLAERLRTVPTQVSHVSSAPTQTLDKDVSKEEGRSDTPNIFNLPPRLTPFVGREIELAEIGAALADPDCRLLTLSGPGGIGKTSLAIEIVKAKAAAFQDGAVFVSLAPLERAEDVVSGIAAALGLVFVAQQNPQAQLLDFFKGRSLLIVLDNFEHVLSARHLIRDLLEVSPASQVLVTSREALGLPGEYLFDVGGMSVPAPDEKQQAEHHDAVQLFIRTARRVRAGFTLNNSAKAQVSQICRMLDGLPLGIELAANWLRMLSVTEILDELKGGLDFLETASRDVPSRHQSLRAVFDYSWGHLSVSEQEVLERLAVFRGGFTRDAAEASAGGSLRQLLGLVNKSLLQRQPSGRFTRLRVVQQYAEEKLAENAEVYRGAKGAHAAYFSALVAQAEPQLTGAEQGTWLDRLSLEYDNIRAALRWLIGEGETVKAQQLAGSLWRFWLLRGYHDEGREALEQAAALGKQDTAEYATVLHGMGALAEDQGDLDKARKVYKQSLTISRKLGLGKAQVGTINNLANLALRQAEFAAAKALYEESLALAQSLGEDWRAAVTLGNLGYLHHRQGELDAAEHYLRASLELAQRLGNDISVTIALNNLGDIARERQDFGRARARYQEALELSRTLGYQKGVAALLTDLARVSYAQGETKQARELHHESLALKQSLGDQQGVAVSHLHLGKLAQAEKAFDEAWSFYRDSLRRFSSLGDRQGVLEVLEASATLLCIQDRPREALQLADAAALERLALKSPLSPHDEAWLEGQLAPARRALGDDLPEATQLTTDQAIECVLSEIHTNHT